MSYILDALKKSQTDQDHQVVGIGQQRQGISVIWVWLLGIALVLNLGVLSWFILSERPTGTIDHAQTIDSAPESRQRVEPTRVSTALPIDQATTVAADSVANPTAASTPESSTSKVDRADYARPATPIKQKPVPVKLWQLDELSQSDQRRFSELSFTSHIYTDDVDLCAVVINGQRLRNGDTINDLKVHRVTPQGVVFEESTRTGIRQVEVNPFE